MPLSVGSDQGKVALSVQLVPVYQTIVTRYPSTTSDSTTRPLGSKRIVPRPIPVTLVQCNSPTVSDIKRRSAPRTSRFRRCANQ